MENLPYELISHVLQYCNVNNKIVLCESNKVFFYLRSMMTIQICHNHAYDNEYINQYSENQMSMEY